MPTTDNRREFLRTLAQGTALAVTGGLPWAYLVKLQGRVGVGALRPPGALLEEDFAATCIKCGQCVTACPYGSLSLASLDDPAPPGTPFFTARSVPCYMCPDIPCMKACPTGALDPGLARIEDARMGLAVIDEESCLSWQGLRCEICHRECPLGGEAISLDVRQREKSKHAVFLPIVHSDACTGCGVCEKACPTEVAAIKVLPPEEVRGLMGTHYRLGWEHEAAITQDYEAPEESGFVAEPETVLDYLNTGSDEERFPSPGGTP